VLILAYSGEDRVLHLPLGTWSEGASSSGAVFALDAVAE